LAPAYLLDLDRLARRHGEFSDAFSRRFDRLAIAYSYKTNFLPEICRRLHRAGALAEVVSGLEYEIARRLGVPGDRIVFNGPGRPVDELRRAFSEGALVHLDSAEEVELAVELLAGGEVPGTARVGLRLSADLAFGRGERRLSRFGFDPRGEELRRAAERLFGAGAGAIGLHIHTSSKSRNLDVFRSLAATLGSVGAELGLVRVASLEAGGGFGIAPEGMTDLAFPDLDEYADAVRDELERTAPGAARLPILIEPGIAMVGDAMELVAPVRAVRERNGHRVATIDASVHTVRPTRHRRALPIRALDARGAPKPGAPVVHDLVGYTCMEDDVVAAGVELPPLEPGDLVRIGGVGAYTWVFKPRFIRAAPRVLAVEAGRWTEVHPPESVEEFVYGQRL